MSKLYKLYEKRKRFILPILGLIMVSLIALPYLILGENSYIQVHDQMDGEILNYIYQAKYLFGGQVIPEFMNGMTKASMLPPAPFGVLFYLVFSPFTAFALMHLFLLLTGFMGMYLLLQKCEVRDEICFLCGVLFCYIPFYPVYGLAVLGQPLLILCFWNLLEKKKQILSLAGIALYAGFSSLALIGYAWVCFGILFVLYMAIKKKGTYVKQAILGTMMLTAIYLLTNMELLTSFFSKTGFITHREEMKLLPSENLWNTAKGLLETGGSYAPVYGKVLVPATFLLLIVIFILISSDKKDMKMKTREKIIAILLGATLVGICLCTLWTSSFILNIRQSIGGSLAYFQADRIYWIFPFIWMVILAFDLDILMEMAHKITVKRITDKRITTAIRRVGVIIFAGLLFLVQGVQIAKDSTLNKNARLMFLSGYHQITWKSLYMEDVFDEIKSAIADQEITGVKEDDNTDIVSGENSGTYSVVSLGMYPSIPLYNGFTCADGYSNNYSLDYKHQFRKIIAGELEKNDESKRYFDEWGNRLYLVSNEYGFNALMQKGQGYQFTDLQFDIDAMKDLQIQYIFAAAPITDSEELGLTLMDGSPFSSNTSYYEVWVYRVNG